MMSGEELKTLRESKALSQAQLARMLEVNVMSVSRWERGERKISPQIHKLIQLLLGKVKPDQQSP